MIRKPTLQSLRHSRYLLFLSTLVLLLLGASLLRETLSEALFFVTLTGLVLVAAFRIISERPRQWKIALAFALLWLVLALWGITSQESNAMIVAHLLFIIFIGYVLGIILGNVMSAEEVDFDILLGAAAVYLLIGIIWAFSYLIIYELDPGGFSLAHDESLPTAHHFLYFSLTTLTTLGYYVDITPLSPFVQIWATFETVFGTFYMALLVARLVGIYQSQHPPGSKGNHSL